MIKDTNMTQNTFENTYNQFTPDVFRDPLFGELRVFIDSNKQVWFVGSEVANRLGYDNPWKAIRDHVRPEYKQEVPNLNLTNRSVQVGHGGSRAPMILIHEFGLYALCMRSQLPNAIPFQQWVYQTIQNMRMYGVSMSPQLKTVLEIDEEQAYRAAQQKIIEQQNRIDSLEVDRDRLFKYCNNMIDETNYRGRVANDYYNKTREYEQNIQILSDENDRLRNILNRIKTNIDDYNY